MSHYLLTNKTLSAITICSNMDQRKLRFFEDNFQNIVPLSADCQKPKESQAETRFTSNFFRPAIKTVTRTRTPKTPKKLS